MSAVLRTMAVLAAVLFVSVTSLAAADEND